MRFEDTDSFLRSLTGPKYRLPLLAAAIAVPALTILVTMCLCCGVGGWFSPSVPAPEGWTLVSRVAPRTLPSKPVQTKGDKFLVKWMSRRTGEVGDPFAATIVVLSGNRQIETIEASRSGDRIISAPPGSYRFMCRSENVSVVTISVFQR